MSPFIILFVFLHVKEQQKEQYNVLNKYTRVSIYVEFATQTQYVSEE